MEIVTHIDTPFKTVDEQIELLRSRGMPVEDEDRLILMREGYYSIINGYKSTFIDSQATPEAGDDRYRKDTSLEHTHFLFGLDRALREYLSISGPCGDYVSYGTRLLVQ